MVEGYFKKLPALPKGGRDFIVMVLPWFSLIVGILGIVGAISSLGLFSSFSAYMYWGGVSGANYGIVVLVLGLISSVLLLMAFPKLQKKKEGGWNFVYYSEVVGLISSVVMFSLGGILMSLIGFYLLYQVRSYFK